MRSHPDQWQSVITKPTIKSTLFHAIKLSLSRCAMVANSNLIIERAPVGILNFHNISHHNISWIRFERHISQWKVFQRSNISTISCVHRIVRNSDMGNFGEFANQMSFRIFYPAKLYILQSSRVLIIWTFKPLQIFQVFTKTLKWSIYQSFTQPKFYVIQCVVCECSIRVVW